MTAGRRGTAEPPSMWDRRKRERRSHPRLQVRRAGTEHSVAGAAARSAVVAGPTHAPGRVVMLPSQDAAAIAVRELIRGRERE